MREVKAAASLDGPSSGATTLSATVADPPPRATKITVAVLGLLVAFAGIEHGVWRDPAGPGRPRVDGHRVVAGCLCVRPARR